MRIKKVNIENYKCFNGKFSIEFNLDILGNPKNENTKKLFCLGLGPDLLETDKFVPLHLIKSHLDEVTSL